MKTPGKTLVGDDSKAPGNLARDDLWAAARPALGRVPPPHHHSNAAISMPVKQAPVWRHADLRGSLPLCQHSSWLASVALYAWTAQTRGKARGSGEGRDGLCCHPQ